MLQKQAVPINFSQGIDTKSDPKQIPIGKFLNLENSVFTKAGLLQKRNGFNDLISLPNNTQIYASTFNDDLITIGKKLYSYSASSSQWVDKGFIQPCAVNTQALIRNNLNQFQGDVAISADGVGCVVYTEQNVPTLTDKVRKYMVFDVATGAVIAGPVIVPNASFAVAPPRVFLLGNYFIIVFADFTVSTTLKYITVNSTAPTSVASSPISITTSYGGTSAGGFDGVVFSNKLYLAWNGDSSSGIKMATLDEHLVLSASVNPDSAHTATQVSVCADETTNIIWVSYNATTAGYSLAVYPTLAVKLAATPWNGAVSVSNIASAAQGGKVTVLVEVPHNYTYDSGTPSNFIDVATVTEGGTVAALAAIARSVGLASKAFLLNGTLYFVSCYQSPYQDTYFLMDLQGRVIAKLAYTNGGGYLPFGLPSVSLSGQTIRFPYLIKDLITSVNKDTNVVAGTQVSGVYSQTGINLASITLGVGIVSSEIGLNLNISGGFLWAYDGYQTVEQGFFLYPDDIKATSTGSGSMSAQPYFYQVTYEWTDSQGNAFKSAPSIPVTVTTVGGSNAVVVNFPYLRLTYKVLNPVKVVIYRWSVNQPIYYQTTSITQPIINDPTSDSGSFTDTNSDATILGNSILYTTGGVVENIGPPATNITTLFDDRLWLVDAEDQNLLWFSKQALQAAPADMSDLLTMYIAPNTGAQGSTGVITALSPLDEKLCVFKKNAILYINGTGPDNTGANSNYSPPNFITATVGCDKPNSIVFIPSGLMFQSDKGIWLLGRDLSTNFIGSPVENYTQNAVVLSAVNVPGTNQVRFTLDSGITLMYDYFYGQWGTFTNIPSVSSTLFQGMHTYINKYGQVRQEQYNHYLDGDDPVLLKFTTGWLNLAGLQGYQRAFFFYLLGRYLSPHKLMCDIAYDYNSSPSQRTMITPDNLSPTFGGPQTNGQDTVYGQDTPYGGPGDLENWRIFLDKQRCSAFQLTISEICDASFGIPAGEGLTLSGLNLVVAIKKGFRPISAAHSAGSQ